MRVVSAERLGQVPGALPGVPGWWPAAEGPPLPGPSHLTRYGTREWAGVMSEPMTAEEIIQHVVARAVWAPSVHNTQPWRFTADGGPRLSLHADTGRGLAAADPDGRELMISCGAALFTVRLALRSLGYIPETSVLPDPGQPELVAQVSWRERAAADEFERRLAGHVLTRRTHRGAFATAVSSRHRPANGGTGHVTNLPGTGRGPWRPRRGGSHPSVRYWRQTRNGRLCRQREGHLKERPGTARPRDRAAR